MNLHVDLGQIIITGAIAVIGYLINKQISNFEATLTRHENIIIDLVGNVQKLIGWYEGWNGHERRNR